MAHEETLELEATEDKQDKEKPYQHGAEAEDKYAKGCYVALDMHPTL
jgi:hypothetical protein